MPLYTYRREDGTTFEVRQKFLDEPLETCPTTGQRVGRVVQAAGVIFKGSGFYVTDNKSSSSLAAGSKTARSENGGSENGSKESAKAASTESAPATAAAD